MTGIVYFIVTLVAILIALRVVRKLLAANPDSGFTRFIYGISGPVFEFSSILAIAIYALVGWMIAKVLQLASARTFSGVSATRAVGRRTRL